MNTPVHSTALAPSSTGRLEHARSFRSRERRKRVIIAGTIAALVIGAASARAASANWSATPTDANWVTSGGATNWSTGADTFPGSVSVNTSTDVGTFNSGSTQTSITINSPSLNVAGLVFDTSAAAYTIGSTSGNSLLMSKTSSITMNATVANTETVNAPMVIQLNGGVLTLTNNATDNSKLLNIGGAITAQAAVGGTTQLTLAGTNTGNNTVGGAISDGGATVKLVKNGIGTWLLTGTNTFTGATTVTAGTLTLSGANGALTGTASQTISSGATFILDDRGASSANANRFKDSAAVTLGNGSFFKYLGSDQAATNSTETIGAITPTSGVSTITVSYSGSNAATVTASAATGGFGRTAATGGIALINGTNLGANTIAGGSVSQFLTATTPTLVGTTNGGTTGINASAKDTKIVPYLVGESGTTSGAKGSATGLANTFLTYNSTTGYRPLNPTDEFTNNAIATGSNTYITGATNSGSTGAINSLVINGGNLVINDGSTLTDTSGALLFASSNSIAPSASTGVLAFGAAEGIVSVAPGAVGTISSAIATGATGLTVYGPGTLILSGSSGSAFAGTTNVNNGATLVIGSNGALGTSLLRMNGGTLMSQYQSRTITNTVSANGNFTWTGAGDLTLAGSGANPGFTVGHQVNPTINITAVGAIMVSGAYSLDNGTGSSFNNNPVGPTLASSANLIITGGIFDNNSGNVASATTGQAAFKFSGAGANLKIIGNNGFGGIQTTSTVITPTVGAGYNTITIGGPGGSGATITPFGLGALNTNSGVGVFLVANTAGQILGNNISLGASTNNDNGRPIGFDGTNDLTLGGTFTLGAAITVPNISSATLTFGNTVTTGANNLTILGRGNTTFNSTGALSGSSANFTKTGPGTLTLAGTNNLTGSTILNGGTTVLDYSAANANRITQGTTATALTLSGADLQLKGGSHTQALGINGGTTLNIGQSKITRTNSGTSTIALGAIARAANNGAVIDFGTGAATTTSSNSASGILGGYATVGGADWAVANGGGSAISELLSYTPLTATTTTTANNYLFAGDGTGLTTSSTAQSVNTLKITTSAAGTLTLGNTLTVVTGGLLFTGGNNYQITGSTLRTSTGTATDLVVHQYGAGELEIASQIINGSGAAGLTKTGSGTLVLSNANNTYSGTTFLNGGILKIGASGNLGTGGLSFNGGTLQTTTGFVAGTGRVVALNSNGGTFQVDAGTLEINGVVSGGYGGLTKTGNGTLLLSNSNTFTGPTTITAGTLKLGHALGLGTSATTNNKALSPVTVNGGTLDIASFNVGLGNVTLTSGSILDSVGGGSIGAYSFTLQSGTVGAALADVAVPVATNLSNSIGVTKTTNGAVILSGANTYTGPTKVSGGTLEISGSITGSAAINVTSGTLLLTGTAGGTDSKLKSTADVTLSSGTLDLTGITNLAISQSVGALSLSGNSKIDFGSLNGNIFKFANSSSNDWASFTLSVYHWSAGEDHLFFGTDDNSGLGSAQLGQITFFGGTPSSPGSPLGTAAFVPGGNGELTLAQVPEPSTLGLVAGALGLIGFHERRRLARLPRR